MLNLFVLIYSGGRGWEVHEIFGGGGAKAINFENPWSDVIIVNNLSGIRTLGGASYNFSHLPLDIIIRGCHRIASLTLPRISNIFDVSDGQGIF
jgi:hypothetical protein